MSSPQRVRVILALVATLAVVALVSNRLLALLVLIGIWLAAFLPLSAGELMLFGLAPAFFTIQNYVCLKAGLFEFRDKDVLLMPYFEPFLWGFYFLALKRFLSGPGRFHARVDWRSVAGTVVTSIVFSLFAYSSRALFLGTLGSTALLLLLFHAPADWRYAAGGLVLGAIVELFGVTQGIWKYPAPDVAGLPFWFATMWVSVGLLGRRFAIPAAEWLGERLAVSARSGPAR